MQVDLKVLIVDDATVQRKIAEKTLRKLGFCNFIVAENGEEAWLQLEQHKQDPVGLILCDWNMPVMDGLELLKLCKKNEIFQSVPFVMISAVSREEEIKKVLDEGAILFITKPISLEDFRQILSLKVD